MKRNILIAATAALTMVCGRAAAQEQMYARSITVEPVRMVRSGETIHIDLDIAIRDLKVRPAAGLDLIPVMSAPGNQLDLPRISLKGRSEYRAWERRMSTMTRRQRNAYREPYMVERARGWNTRVIRYRHTLPAEAWMDGADVQLRVSEYGCGVVRGADIAWLGEVGDGTPPQIAAYIVNPRLSYIIPAIEAVKVREKQAEVFLDFPVNRIEIRPDFMNNPRELAKIYELFDELRNDPHLTITHLDIIGFASPEGPLEHNKRLSEGRAKALRDYLATQYDFSHDMYNIVFGGENWDGLAAALDSFDVPYEDEVRRIIADVAIDDGRERQLMELRGGAPFRYMLANIFPRLRVAICKVEFNVKGFTEDEAREVIVRNPQNLSLHEMFLLANTYNEDTPEFSEVLETAARIYSGDEVALLNAAAAALARGDLDAAERYLSRVKTPPAHMPEYDNARGVLLLLRSDADAAESHLRRAADAGLEAAQYNLQELENKRKEVLQ